jgi:hypothetical protein
VAAVVVQYSKIILIKKRDKHLNLRRSQRLNRNFNPLKLSELKHNSNRNKKQHLGKASTRFSHGLIFFLERVVRGPEHNYE